MAKKHKYEIIEEFIKKQIEIGTFKQGERIYSETKLSEIFKVTRITVRQAISNLTIEGYLYSIKGSGTYVTDSKISKNIKGLTSFTEDVNMLGKESSSKLIKLEVIRADKKTAKKLNINIDDLVFNIERIRYADEEPWGYEIVLRPFHFTPNLTEEDNKDSMFKNLEQKGIEISYSDQVVEAVLSDKTISKSLGVKPGSPILLIKSTTYLKEEIPLQYTRSFYRGDKYKFINRAFRK